MAAPARGAALAAASYVLPMALLEKRVSAATLRGAAAIGSGVLVTRVLRAHLEEDESEQAWLVALLSAGVGTLCACAVQPDLASGLTGIEGAREGGTFS